MVLATTGAGNDDDPHRLFSYGKFQRQVQISLVLVGWVLLDDHMVGDRGGSDRIEVTHEDVDRVAKSESIVVSAIGGDDQIRDR